jgi:hypothetical protein
LNLETTPAQFPLWEGSTLIKLQQDERRPQVTQIEYKYAIVRESDGQTKQWETFTGNRVLHILHVKQANIEDSFGEKNHERVEIFQWMP